jgi:1-acyl-sn-glycerol-3-phosphate acyltransferase
MLPFRDGAFRAAIESGAPILPIVVAGTRYGMAKGSLLFNRTIAEARVLDPIPTEGMTLDDLPALRELARERIGTARDALLRELENA